MGAGRRGRAGGSRSHTTSRTRRTGTLHHHPHVGLHHHPIIHQNLHHHHGIHRYYAGFSPVAHHRYRNPYISRPLHPVGLRRTVGRGGRGYAGGEGDTSGYVERYVCCSVLSLVLGLPLIVVGVLMLRGILVPGYINFALFSRLLSEIKLAQWRSQLGGGGVWQASFAS